MIPIENLWKFDLRRGTSDHPGNGACLMDAANWIVHQRIGDNPPETCPVIRAYAIGLNDLLPDGERQRLKRFILRVAGTRDPASERERAEYLMRQATSTILPLALEVEAAVLAQRAMALCRGETVDTGHEDAGVAALSAARGATAAAEFARQWFDSADWKAAASDSARIARAATDAVTTPTAKQRVYKTAIGMLDGVLKFGKQADAPQETEVHLAVRAFERTRKMPAAA